MEEAIERGETGALLDKDRRYTEDGSLDVHGKRALRHNSGNWRAAGVILGVEVFESLAYYGVATNLVMYIGKVLHEGNASNAASMSTWIGTGFLAPILGAVIADSYCGRYRTTLASALIYLLGMVIVTLSASIPALKPPSCEQIPCPPATNAQKLVFFSGLYLIAVGCGGIKSALLPLGADQFEEGNPTERQMKESFFNWFYFAINIGALISSTVIVWIEENIDWALGFGIATFSMALAFVAFLSGTPIYRLQRPSESPIKRILQVFVASLRKASLQVTDSSDLYELWDQKSTATGSRKLVHTDDFRFLDRAATMSATDAASGKSPNPWRLCTVTQVEELKILLRLLPIWLTNVIYFTVYSQLFTTFIEQGNAMDTNIGLFSVPPAFLFAFEVLSVLFWVFIYDTLINKIITRFMGSGLSELQRMGVGRFLLILSMSLAALVEMKRLERVGIGESMTIAWQLPQYFVLGVSEAFSSVGMLEFFYGQAPDNMRSICIAFSWLTISLGSYLNSLIVTFITFVTTRGGQQPGWIPDDLNSGHLDYFFWTMVGLSSLNFGIYVLCARWYKLKKVVVED